MVLPSRSFETGVDTANLRVDRVDDVLGGYVEARHAVEVEPDPHRIFEIAPLARIADTASPLPDVEVVPIGLRLPAAAISERVTRRVDQQFAGGLLDEIRTLLARGIPERARPFGGLVYRQALEHLHGVRDEAATRALIAQENRRYARRQLIWFRKEPNLQWFDGPGDSPQALAAVQTLLDERLTITSP